MCLQCGETNCGRYGNKHSLGHWQKTKREQEATMRVEQVASGMEALGHCLALGLEDLTVWCYECQAYVHHEKLHALIKHAEKIKHGEDGCTACEPDAAPSVGTSMAVQVHAMHGRLGDPAWAAPQLARACDDEARPGYKTKKAHEYLDVPEVLDKKVKLLAELMRKSKNCVAYTGAGISTSSGISDYATKARNSIATSSTDGAKASPWAARPTPAHRVLVGLHKRGILKHWVQQNHDGLPQKAGYPQNELNEIHGAWFDPSNPVVPMDGTLRTDLIEWLLEWEDKVDLCLALGTSMVGMNADRIPVAAAQRAKSGIGIGMVIVALQETQYDLSSALRIFAPIDEVLTRLVVELELEVAAASSGAATDTEQIFDNLPYDEKGAFKSGAKLSLDLREGSKVGIVNQPDWDKKRWGPMGVVIQAQNSLQEEGHIAIRMGGEGGVIRVLGRWWLDDARQGKVPHLPVVPWVEK